VKTSEFDVSTLYCWTIKLTQSSTFITC